MSGHSQSSSLLRRVDNGLVTTLRLEGDAGAAWLKLDVLQAMIAILKTLHGSGRLLLIRGSDDGFCRGMSLEDVVDWPAGQSTRVLHQTFQDLLQALTRYDSATVAAVEGDAFGGGVALVSACDFVVADANARFALPELLWGLLPANAAPYVTARMGYAAARRMTLLTEPISAETAYLEGLVDVVTHSKQTMEGVLRRFALRAKRLPKGSISAVRELFEKLQNDPSAYRQYAVNHMTALTDDPNFRQSLAEQYKRMMET